MFKKVYDHLTDHGLEVYPIGIDPDYKDPLIILKDSDPIEVVGYHYTNNLAYLYCHYPLGDYIKVLDYKTKIKEVMDQLPNFDMLETGDYIQVDEETKTYLFVLQYNNKRIRRY